MKTTSRGGLLVPLLIILGLGLIHGTALAESKQEYHNRLRLMLDFAVRTNEYVRQHLGDRGVSAYAHAMAEKNAAEAEKMTPPPQYALFHPHFLLVLENIERSFFFAAQGKMAPYRRHQRVVRRELQILEAMAESKHVDLYMWEKGY